MEEFSRIQRLPPYVFNITGELKASARKRGEDIIDFGMGNPDGATPQHIVDKMIEAARRQTTHRYSLSKGIPRLRKAICTWYQTRYGIDFDPESEAIVTIGSKEGIAHLCLATLSRGDTVLVPNPSYPIHIYGPVIAGADVMSVPVHNKEDFLAELENVIPRMIPRARMDLFKDDRRARVRYLELIQLEHEQIYQAIARRDAEAARAAVRLHLTNSRERLRVALDSIAAAQRTRSARPASRVQAASSVSRKT